MKRMLLLGPLIAGLALAGCGEPVRDDHFANDAGANAAAAAAAAAPNPVVTEAAPVRIGELGPSFDACAAAGTTRNIAAGAALQVRAAPFDTAADSGAISAGARFFICSRSIDQKWFGVVFDEAGALSHRCGVSAPATRRRSYEGPCRSGWVESAFVKVIAGNEPEAAPAENAS